MIPVANRLNTHFRVRMLPSMELFGAIRLTNDDSIARVMFLVLMGDLSIAPGSPPSDTSTFPQPVGRPVDNPVVMRRPPTAPPSARTRHGPMACTRDCRPWALRACRPWAPGHADRGYPGLPTAGTRDGRPWAPCLGCRSWVFGRDCRPLALGACRPGIRRMPPPALTHADRRLPPTSQTRPSSARASHSAASVNSASVVPGRTCGRISSARG